MLPAVSCHLPTRRSTSPIAVPATADVVRVRAVLEQIVRANDLDPGNPWAVVHGMLALGPDAPLTNGKPASDFLFSEYGEWHDVGGKPAVGFPHSRGAIRVEPHTDLILKALTEGGVPFDRPETVQAKPATPDDLFRYSLWKTWVEGDALSVESYNDLPWTLQGLAACTPGDVDLAWTAQGGHSMTLDALTDAVVRKLHAETQFLRDAMASGAAIQKRKQGIFAYTCGGTHLIMGASYAVARGHGTPEDRDLVLQEIPPLLWRLDLELASVDQLLPVHPEYEDVLLDQRMKFLGHFLETTHKLAALGLFTPDDAQKAVLARALNELVATVDKMSADHLITPEALAARHAKNEQAWLDYIGDSAHAIRGIDLATGSGAIAR